MARRLLIIVALLSSSLVSLRDAAADAPLPAVVEYNRDIRPILSDNCYACHGPDKNARKAELRLDDEEEAKKYRKGHRVIASGKPDESEILARLTESDESMRMPPKKFGKRPTERQIALIKKWLDQGARWEKHWSLIAPRRPALPVLTAGLKPAARSAIDHFILARLQQEGLSPSATTATTRGTSRTGSGRSSIRACSPSTPRRARSAPASGRGRTSRSRPWSSSMTRSTSRPPASSPNGSSSRAVRTCRRG